MRLFTGICLILGFMACKRQQAENNITEKEVADVEIIRPEYATGFEIEVHPGFSIIRVDRPWNQAESGFRYLLLEQAGREVPPGDFDAIIKGSPERILCTSTTHLPMLEMLGAGKKLVGFPGTDLISSPYFISRMDSITDVGSEKGINIEKVIEIQPDLVITFGTGYSFDQLEALKRTGIPFVIDADYMENHPLGRAEWIRFFGAFLGMGTKADSIFHRIRDEYLSLRSRVPDTPGPTVLTGVMYGDTWFMPGGRNYAAQFFRDAGAIYLWSENNETGWLELGFESVYDQAYDAQFWVGVASFNSRSEMVGSDHRYGLFAALKRGNVFNYNARIGPGGGNEYLETGYARPDWVLADLIHIFHPELLPGHTLYYYKVLP